MRKFLHLTLAILLMASLSFAQGSFPSGTSPSWIIAGQGGTFVSTIANNPAIDPATVATLQFGYEVDVSKRCSFVCINGATVIGLTDRSSNANNATCSNGPTYVSSALNGKPGVAFVYASAQQCSFGTAITPQTNYTIIAVEKVTSLANYNYIAGPSSPSGLTYEVVQSTGVQEIDLAGVAVLCTGTSGMSAGTFYESTVTYENANPYPCAFQLSGSSSGSGTSPASAILANQTAVAADINDSRYFGGTLIAVYQYNSILSPSTLSGIYTYFHNKYGI